MKMTTKEEGKGDCGQRLTRWENHWWEKCDYRRPDDDGSAKGGNQQSTKGGMKAELSLQGLEGDSDSNLDSNICLNRS